MDLLLHATMAKQCWALRGRNQVKNKIVAHIRLRMGIHHKQRKLTSLAVLVLLAKCLPKLQERSSRLANRRPLPPAPVPPQPLNILDPLAAHNVQDWTAEFASPSELSGWKQIMRGPAHRQNLRPIPKAFFADPDNAAITAKLVELDKTELWQHRGRLPAQGKEYPALGFKMLRERAPKAQSQQPAAATAHCCIAQMESLSSSDVDRDWAMLPDVLLVQIFDIVLTAPTAHPSYLRGKVQSVAYLGRVCRAWKAALAECPIGVCLPAQLPAPACRWLCSVLLRGVEYHDPEHTQPQLVKLLSHPDFVRRSGKSLVSLVDAPYDGSWRPASFPNIVQLVIWRAGRGSAVFDVRRIASLPSLNHLVLAAGFMSIRHLEAWPPSCRRLMWTCPSDSHSSRLSMPRLPYNMGLQCLSLRAYSVRLRGLDSLLGQVAELSVHAAFVFVSLPRHLYPSLVPPALARQLHDAQAAAAAVAAAAAAAAAEQAALQRPGAELESGSGQSRTLGPAASAAGLAAGSDTGAAASSSSSSSSSGSLATGSRASSRATGDAGPCYDVPPAAPSQPALPKAAGQVAGRATTSEIQVNPSQPLTATAAAAAAAARARSSGMLSNSAPGKPCSGQGVGAAGSAAAAAAAAAGGGCKALLPPSSPAAVALQRVEAAVAAAVAAAGRKRALRNHDWAEEGMAAVADLCLPPGAGEEEEEEEEEEEGEVTNPAAAADKVEVEDWQPEHAVKEGHEEESGEQVPEPTSSSSSSSSSSSAVCGISSNMCLSCGRPHAPAKAGRGRKPGPSDARPSGGQDGEGGEEGGGGGGSSDGEGGVGEEEEEEEEEEDSDDEMVYDEVAPNQVITAFARSIQGWQQTHPHTPLHPLTSRGPPYATLPPSTAPAPDQAAAPAEASPSDSVEGVAAAAAAAAAGPTRSCMMAKTSPYTISQGGGESDAWQGPCNRLGLAVWAAPPLLTTGKARPGHDREVRLSRRHLDPREPLQLKLDQADPERPPPPHPPAWTAAAAAAAARETGAQGAGRWAGGGAQDPLPGGGTAGEGQAHGAGAGGRGGGGGRARGGGQGEGGWSGLSLSAELPHLLQSSRAVHSLVFRPWPYPPDIMEQSQGAWQAGQGGQGLAAGPWSASGLQGAGAPLAGQTLLQCGEEGGAQGQGGGEEHPGPSPGCVEAAASAQPSGPRLHDPGEGEGGSGGAGGRGEGGGSSKVSSQPSCSHTSSSSSSSSALGGQSTAEGGGCPLLAAAAQQHLLLSAPSFQAASGPHLHKVNFLLLPPQCSAAQLKAMLAPYLALTKISMVTLEDVGVTPCQGEVTQEQGERTGPGRGGRRGRTAAGVGVGARGGRPAGPGVPPQTPPGPCPSTPLSPSPALPPSSLPTPSHQNQPPDSAQDPPPPAAPGPSSAPSTGSLPSPQTGWQSPFLPVSVVKATFLAGHPDQVFSARCVSNLTELWSLRLSGYHALDLTQLPGVRPGFVLKVVDVPESRRSPLGRRGVDELMAPGHIVGMTVHIGTDKSVSEPHLPLSKVDLLAWARVPVTCTSAPAVPLPTSDNMPRLSLWVVLSPLMPVVLFTRCCPAGPALLLLPLRSPGGVEVHADVPSIPALFRQLTATSLEQFTVCLSLGEGRGEDEEGLPLPPPQPGAQAGLPQFNFVLRSMRVHGLHLAMWVKQGAAVGWSVEIIRTDAGSVEDEEGLVFMTFYRTPEGEQEEDDGVAMGPGPHLAGYSMAHLAQLQLAALSLAVQQHGDSAANAEAGEGPSIIDDLD
ncbi:hypothetical protein QJQ45_017799 [Haematococcus lacustris]|nr:hypothetical protein QJQ45_017799 [Haematococcus lacustris]